MQLGSTAYGLPSFLRHAPEIAAVLALIASMWVMFATRWALGKLFFMAIAGLAVWMLWLAREYRRTQFISTQSLPSFLHTKLRAHYPHLSAADTQQVEQGLRDFFLACLYGKGRFMAMPSQAVDVMWHEFILHTKAYADWCDEALGRFLHHSPAEALGHSAARNDGLRRIWFWCCQREVINPRAPSHLPRLFDIDAALNIPDGFRYRPDCTAKVDSDSSSSGCGGGHCGTHFAEGSYSGSCADFGGAESSGSGSDGDGGGCGGD
ncbi:MAG: hypothetical protein HC765_09255 [Brachymonas sp.]|nr:hypothetical protein [Brachymonas sp.]